MSSISLTVSPVASAMAGTTNAMLPAVSNSLNRGLHQVLARSQMAFVHLLSARIDVILLLNINGARLHEPHTSQYLYVSMCTCIDFGNHKQLRVRIPQFRRLEINNQAAPILIQAWYSQFQGSI